MAMVQGVIDHPGRYSNLKRYVDLHSSPPLRLVTGGLRDPSVFENLSISDGVKRSR